jgi:type II secretory pathway component PulK
MLPRQMRRPATVDNQRGVALITVLIVVTLLLLPWALASVGTEFPRATEAKKKAQAEYKRAGC